MLTFKIKVFMSNVCHGDGGLLTVFLQTVFLSLNSCLVEYRHEIMGTQFIIIQSTTTLAVFPPNSITVLKKKKKKTNIHIESKAICPVSLFGLRS